ncbi:MAG: CAP domain-containing protein [Bacteroidia bacterium]
MNKILNILFVCIILLGKTMLAQVEWSEELLEKANIAKDSSYLTTEEKEIVYYTNLVRLNPELFGKTFIQHYIDSTGKTSNYTKSLLKTLEKAKPMGVLTPSKKLQETAKEHATEFGKKGATGHGNLKKRFAKYQEDCGCIVAENCYYGKNNALNIVIELLIDEGIANLSHRNNILNKELTSTGLFIAPHKTFTRNCVIDYSSEW